MKLELNPITLILLLQTVQFDDGEDAQWLREYARSQLAKYDEMAEKGLEPEYPVVDASINNVEFGSEISFKIPRNKERRITDAPYKSTERAQRTHPEAV